MYFSSRTRRLCVCGDMGHWKPPSWTAGAAGGGAPLRAVGMSSATLPDEEAGAFALGDAWASGAAVNSGAGGAGGRAASPPAALRDAKYRAASN